MLMEATCLMGLIRLAILIFPFRHIASLMGEQMSESPEYINAGMHAKAIEIGWAIRKMSTFTPWESKCLVQALSALIMLKTRKIPSTLYLGIAKNEPGKLVAHAWLRCGELIVTGNRERRLFKAVARFSSLPIKKAISHK